MNEIQKYAPQQTELLTIDTARQYAETFVKTNWFGDIRSAEHGIVKILFGQELGLTPIQSTQQIYVIQGKGSPKLQVSGNLIASKIRQSGRYDYRIVESTNDKCEIEFFLEKENIGSFRYTIEDARRAGLLGKDNWKYYPRDMLFNRCVSGGYKQHCPDIFSIAVYTEADDIPVDNGDYSVVDEAEPDTAKSILKKPEFQMKPVSKKNGTNGTTIEQPLKVVETVNPPEPQPEQNQYSQKKNSNRPLSPATLKNKIAIKAIDLGAKDDSSIKPKTLTRLNILMNELCDKSDAKRHILLEFLLDKISSKILFECEAIALINWMGCDTHSIDRNPELWDYAKQEAGLIYELFRDRFDAPVTEPETKKTNAFEDIIMGSK